MSSVQIKASGAMLGPPGWKPSGSVKALIFALLVPGGLLSQTIAVSSPTAGQPISGIAYTFNSTLTSLPNVCTVGYAVNGERAGYVYSPPWSLTWNTFYVMNNAYNTVVATAYDCLNNVLATSGAVAFSVANSVPESTSAMAFVVSPPLGTIWTGTVTFTLSVTGTAVSANCASNKCVAQLYIDGVYYGNFPLTATPVLYTLDTTRYDNGLHNVVWTFTDLTNPLGTNSWVQVGQWEKQITFSNGATAEQLRLLTPECFILTSGATTCTVTGKVYNTDGTSSAATFSSVVITEYSYSYPIGTVVTLAACSSCTSEVISAVNIGSAYITFTESGGKTRSMWVHVNSADHVYTFNTSGGINSTYAANSLWHTSVFFSSENLGDPNYPAAYTYQQDSLNSFPFPAIEASWWAGGGPNSGQSLSSFLSQQASYVSSMASYLNPYPGLRLHLVGDEGGTTDLYMATQQYSGASPPLPQSIFQSWASSGLPVYWFDGYDEVNTVWGSCPQAGQLTIGGTFSNCLGGGSNTFGSSIPCTSTLCTVTMTPEVFANGGGSGGFIIRGATTHSAFNSSSSTGQFYNVLNATRTTFQFTNPTGSATTITSSTDPGLVIEQLVTIAGWYNANGNGNCVSGCTGYVTYNSFNTFMSAATSVSGRPLMTWPNQGGFGQDSMHNWEGTPASSGGMADYATKYYLLYGNDYLPQYQNQSAMISDVGFDYRRAYGYLGANRLAPMLAEDSGVALVYGLEGATIPGTVSCTGNLCTLSQAYNIGTILPFNTRMWLTGASSGNGNYFIIDQPDSTHIHVALPSAQFSCCSGSLTGVTATVSTGATFPVTSLQTQDLAFGPVSYAGYPSDPRSCGTYKVPNYRGDTVTFATTGSSIGGFASSTWWFIPPPWGTCQPSGGGQAMLEIPNLSLTGGTMTIVQSQAYARGRNVPGPYQGSEYGPRIIAATDFYCIILVNCSGTRAFQSGSDYDDTIRHGGATHKFQDNTNNGCPIGCGSTHPRYLTYGNGYVWHSHITPTKLAARLLPYTSCQNGNAPDYGQYFESALRTGCTAGNVQMVQSFLDGGATRTLDLSGAWANNCNGNTASNNFILYGASWSNTTYTTISGGATSTSVNFDPDNLQFAAVVCPASATAYSTPTISSPLADVPSATKIVVQWGYSPYIFQSPVNTMTLPNATDCTTGTCTLPVDRNIGPVYCRLVYLNSSGAPLSFGDIQQF